MRLATKKGILLVSSIILFLAAIYIIDKGSSGGSLAIIASFMAGYTFAIRHSIKNKEA